MYKNGISLIKAKYILSQNPTSYTIKISKRVTSSDNFM